MKVSIITSKASGKPVANQFIIYDDENNSFFQSYDTIIVKIDNYGNVFLDKNSWDYSRTTSKYRNQFLDETEKKTEKKIASGEYQLVNLND